MLPAGLAMCKAINQLGALSCPRQLCQQPHALLWVGVSCVAPAKADAFLDAFRQDFTRPSRLLLLH